MNIVSLVPRPSSTILCCLQQIIPDSPLTSPWGRESGKEAIPDQGTRLYQVTDNRLKNLDMRLQLYSHGLTTISLLHATRKTSKSVSQYSFASLSHSLPGREETVLEPHTQTTCDNLGISNSFGHIRSNVPTMGTRPEEGRATGRMQSPGQPFPLSSFFTVSNQKLDGGEGLGMRLE